ncbi:MAG: IS110 family transposase, partial [Gemmatimonadota bacterium]|nr:IS110 family transposase [Gemmatimonadota bacterium]
LFAKTNRGDTYLRTLLVHGARAVLRNPKSGPSWVLKLAENRPTTVARVALANKRARTIWALLAHDRKYQPNYGCPPA